MREEKKVIIIGAGIAGLTCAYKLVTESDNIKPVIIEKDGDIGGLARTFDYDGNYADIGPHRFFTKNEKVMEFWKSLLPLQGHKASDDILLGREPDFKDGCANPEVENNVFLKRKRFSRIYYMKKFFDYPINPNLKTVMNFGILRTVLCVLSYIKSCVVKREEKNLEDFMINRFGRVLYRTFFEFYTEKVWGRNPKNIDKSWGAQRIKGLSLLKSLLNKFSPNGESSLTNEYYYPKFGAKQMCSLMLKTVLENGGEIYTNTKVIKINKEENRIKSLTIENNDEISEIYGDYVVSSMPVKDLICSMNNTEQNVYDTAKGLPYRDYQLITYLVKDFNLKNSTKWETINNICPDSWIYIQDRDVKIGRIYIPKNFSPYLCKNIDDTLICLEYFCDKNDALWNMSDDEIFRCGIVEMKKINAVKSEADIIKSYRLKVENAYPAYFDAYKDFDVIKFFINSIENLYCIGRNGQHKYNNMDHSTLSGIIASEMIIQKSDKTALWEVNTDSTYQETI